MNRIRETSKIMGVVKEIHVHIVRKWKEQGNHKLRLAIGPDLGEVQKSQTGLVTL